MVRSQCCDHNISLKKGPWTAEEDEKLLTYIQEHGHGSWRSLPTKAGLQRCGKSCRLRWTNYLRPDIKRGKFSLQEEQTIIQLHALLGNRWSAIAAHLPKRTDNEIKNYWNSHLKKRLTKLGIDPMTHKPQNQYQSKEIANISHMAQWESARLQAEARLVRESKLISDPYLLCPPPLAPMPRPPCLDILKVWEWTNPGKDISSMILNMGPNEPRGTFGNSMELHHAIATYVDQDSLGFPSFIDDLDLPPGNSNNTLGGCWEVLEENNSNCWSNTGSPMF